MNERLIELTDINPVNFFGVNNANLQILIKHFPKLKIIARGSTIKTFGEADILDEFERVMERLTAHYHRYNALDENTIERLLFSAENSVDINDSEVLLHGVNGKIIKAKTKNQKAMVKALQKNDMLFAVGPAGTGKTYTAVAIAVKMLKDKQIRRIILTRPAVEAGENLGFLPGDLKEKLDPYMQPLYDALRDMIPHEKLHSYFEKGVIQIAPLAFMRGRTLNDSFVILDEAQNATHSQMKMFLTRMGTHAKFVVTGDPGQVDLPTKQVTGLKEVILALKNIKGISIVYLKEEDVMRHRLVKRIIEVYNIIEGMK
ncbi:MAG: phosphate starvation-inducible protein PhoH [Flavobacteriia bacterium]|nr:MAG: phosphate starvation-inducible protein PhoH [Flavobacteriia bacterium]